jgi:hypothetical protein
MPQSRISGLNFVKRRTYQDERFAAFGGAVYDMGYFYPISEAENVRY